MTYLRSTIIIVTKKQFQLRCGHDRANALRLALLTNEVYAKILLRNYIAVDAREHMLHRYFVIR